MKYIYESLEQPGRFFEIEQSIQENSLNEIFEDDKSGDVFKDMSKPDYTRIYKVHKVKRIITGGQGFILQGTGWAKDNYSKPKKK